MIKILSNLDFNEPAMIDSLDQEKLKAEYILELIDYGFLPGSDIKLLQKYPSQNKIIVQIGNARLSLRINDADCIQVKTYE